MQTQDLWNKFMETENMYRPMPFWSWNDRLEPKLIEKQISAMHEQGIGGFVIHARSGLITEYMSKEWFEAVDAAVNCAETLEMCVWIYDENGWPSGFGNGTLNGKGIAYQQKYLRMEKGEKHTETTICNVDGYHFYYDVNPYYVDTLDERIIGEFISFIYEAYYERYGNRIQGFFTDEPQISRDGIPWSFRLEDAYREEYGEELLPLLKELFMEEGEFQKTRVRFWRLVTKMFSTSYVKQIGDWCRAHGLKLTGHLVLEETLISQLTTNGACMPHYMHWDMPGVDWLGGEKRDILSGAGMPLTFKQIESVAHQFGKKKILTETFAASGSDISFSEMRGLVEWQMVRGITNVCPHLQAYSTRGQRKRDYPPTLFWQQPWWDTYKKQNDYIARVGMLLSEGTVDFHMLLIHNQSSAWVCYPSSKEKITAVYQKSLEKAIEVLENAHVLFHLGDELIMEEFATVNNGELIIGNQKYNEIILPEYCILLESTERLLKEFVKQGGKILDLNEVKKNPVVNWEEILYTQRKFEDMKLHYFVNATDHEIKNVSVVGQKFMNPCNGAWEDFSGSYSFGVNDSLVTLEMPESVSHSFVPKVSEKEYGQDLAASNLWELIECSENVLLLDVCDYYFDGVLQEKDGHILNVLERVCARKKKTIVDLLFYPNLQWIPKKIYLAGEDLKKKQIIINGSPIDFEDAGSFVDESIRKMDIHHLLRKGINEIHVQVEFALDDSFYEKLERAYIFESELNNLTWPVEFEALYLVGEFGVYHEKHPIPHGEHWNRSRGSFYIERLPQRINLKNMEQQGFAFFAGKLKVEQRLEKISKTYQVFMEGIQSVEMKIQAEDTEKQFCTIWNGETMETGIAVDNAGGMMQLVLRNNLRNLWGPHHYCMEESITAWPSSFYQESKLQGNIQENWIKEYVFRNMSIEIR